MIRTPPSFDLDPGLRGDRPQVVSKRRTRHEHELCVCVRNGDPLFGQRMPDTSVWSDRDAVLSLYCELRPSDLQLPSDKASELCSKANEAPRPQIIVAEHEGHVDATCMLALIANIASGGRPVGFIEHVVTMNCGCTETRAAVLRSTNSRKTAASLAAVAQ